MMRFCSAKGCGYLILQTCLLSILRRICKHRCGSKWCIIWIEDCSFAMASILSVTHFEECSFYGFNFCGIWFDCPKVEHSWCKPKGSKQKQEECVSEFCLVKACFLFNAKAVNKNPYKDCGSFGQNRSGDIVCFINLRGGVLLCLLRWFEGLSNMLKNKLAAWQPELFCYTLQCLEWKYSFPLDNQFGQLILNTIYNRNLCTHLQEPQ